jgi:hypothetical protein
VSEGAKDGDPKNTLAGPRNFSVKTEERLRALIAGPPAFALRRRKIEDLETSILRAIVTHESKTGSFVDSSAPPAGLARPFAALCGLIEAHNRYYPIEAALPIDVATGELLDLGRRWIPLPVPTWGVLVARARGRHG